MSFQPAQDVTTELKRRRPVGWVALAFGGLLSMPIIVLVGAFVVFRASDTISPGVRVGEVALGGMSLDQAIERLDTVWNRELRITAVDTNDAGRIWLATPSEFGLAVDAAASARLAHQYGRQSPPFAAVQEMLNAFTRGWELAPIVTFDKVQARAGLASWAASAAVEAQDAQLGLNAGEISASPAVWGRQLDVNTSLELLSADPASVLLTYGFVPLVTSEVAPRIQEVAGAAAEARQTLSRGAVLRAYDPVTDEWLEWFAGREEVSSWLAVRFEGSGLGLEIDPAQISGYVERLVSGLGEQRTLDSEAAVGALLASLEGNEVDPLQIRYQPRYYVVEPGDTLISISFKVGIPYWKWLESNPQVSTRGLELGESLTIPPRDAMLELPVVRNKRIVVSISEQRMWLFQDGEPLLEHIVSTGIPNSPTLPGLFQVKSRYENAYASNWDLTMPNFLGIYHATPNLLNGIHGLPLLSNGVRLWADVLGSPASYGCIILDLEAAERLFEWAEDGVIVEITS
jgi:LysM repeat protein